MSVRTDSGTWTECRDVSPAAVILLTPSPTYAIRQDDKQTSILPLEQKPHENIFSSQFCRDFFLH